MVGNSVGIVLQMEPAEGDTYEGEDGLGNAAASVELVSPPELFAARLEEPPPIDVRMESVPLSVAAPVTSADAQQERPRPPSPAPAAANSVNASLESNIRASRQGRAGLLAGQGYAHVRVFGVEGRGNKFVYAFDRSSSMEGGPLQAAKRQLIDSLGSLTNIHQFHIIFFNHRLQSFDITGGGRRIAFATDRNKQLAANFVGGIVAEGGTDRFAALKAALGFSPDVIFFLTDADDPMPASELYDINRDAERAGAAICVIEFGREEAPTRDNFLQALARLSGGQYGYVNAARLGR
jgi:hypothetical protein